MFWKWLLGKIYIYFVGNTFYARVANPIFKKLGCEVRLSSLKTEQFDQYLQYQQVIKLYCSENEI